MYCKPKGSDDVIRIASGIFFPNGLAVQHNAARVPSMLIVAETPTKTLWAFDIEAAGRVFNKRVWGKLPGN